MASLLTYYDDDILGENGLITFNKVGSSQTNESHTSGLVWKVMPIWSGKHTLIEGRMYIYVVGWCS